MKLQNKWLILGNIALVGALASTGCGDEATTPQPTVLANSNGVEAKQQFLIWNPPSDLVNRHTCWHYTACGQPCTGVTGTGRSCTNTGEDFLAFHRGFLQQLRSAWEAQQLTGDIAPWTTLPPEMKLAQYGWDSTVAAAENAVLTMTDPATGKRFATVNDYGNYIESHYHGQLHSIASSAYYNTDQQIGQITSSPTSTYFFKIHGYIDYLYSRYQHSDFNKDGSSDIIEHDDNNGNVNLWLTSGTTVSQTINIGNVLGCNYYVGAVADLDFDGNPDLIWHGPGCNSVVFWKMQGTTHTGPDVVLPNVDSNWRLIGAADYNHDNRPDLLWRYNSTASSTIVFWQMNGTTVLPGVVINDPVPGFQAVAPIDTDNDLVPDILLQSNTAPRTWKVLRTNGNFGVTTTNNNFMGNIPTDSSTTIVGVGRFQSAVGSSWSDVLVRTSPPQLNQSYSFGLLQWSNGFASFYSPVVSGGTILSSQSLWGPR